MVDLAVALAGGAPFAHDPTGALWPPTGAADWVRCPACQPPPRVKLLRCADPWRRRVCVEAGRLGAGPAAAVYADGIACVRRGCGARITVWRLRRMVLEDPDALTRLIAARQAAA